MQNKGHYAVLSHSRWLIFGTYVSILVTCIISPLFPRCHKLLVTDFWWRHVDCFCLMHSFVVHNCKIWPQETGDVPVSYGVKCISISWTIWAWLTNVTDSQTDRHTDSKCCTSLHCAADKGSPCIWLFVIHLLILIPAGIYNSETSGT